MESIGDVLKGMASSASGSILERAEARFQALLAHPELQTWMAAQPAIADEELRRHMNSLYQLVRDRQHCAQCPGLEQCPNDFPGHCTTVDVKLIDGSAELLESRQPCAKWTANQAEMQLKKRVRSFYVAGALLQTDYSASEMISLDLERAPAVSQLLKYVLHVQENGLTNKGLYLYGPFGTGKTHMLSYLLRELGQSGYSGAIVYMPDFVEDVKAMIQEPQRLKETVEWLKSTDLLVFDDLGAENLSPWVRDHVFGAILNERMGRKPTFFTSNFDLGSLLKHFSFTNREGAEEHKGQRIMERIKPFVDTIYVGGSNKRGMTGGS